MWPAGALLGDRYRLDEPIASGGMGEVWRATDLTLDRVVAVKAMRPGLAEDAGFDARFRAEARTLAALSHPNVVNVYDYGRDEVAGHGAVVYLVMAYVHGQPLSDRIAAAGHLPAGQTMSIVAQAAEALQAAHACGVVHRDVKPANLLVQPDGTVTLVDFGVARTPAAAAATTGHVVLGTALYMAPEQASGGEVSPATDVYALGAVAYHCLAGQPPFLAGSALEVALRQVLDEPAPLPDDVPPAARQLVARAMAKDPADRYPTAAALAAAARMPVDTVPPADTVRLPAVTVPARRSHRRAALVGAAAALVLGLAALATALWPSATAGTGPQVPAGPAASAALSPRPAGSAPVTKTGSPRRTRSAAPSPTAPRRAPSTAATTASPRIPSPPAPSVAGPTLTPQAAGGSGTPVPVP
jgi:serine/threonine-protein kinase